MCGIVGCVDFTGRIDEATLRTMSDTLAHRGPDGEGQLLLRRNGTSVGFAHRRLSIIDLSDEGLQPMSEGSSTIVFNGEIYNYKEIKASITPPEHGYHSGTDTEVLLHLLKTKGLDALSELVGMFAFAWYDGETNTLSLVRDRAGVKPLYYYFDGSLFIFGSELKALMALDRFPREIDYDALGLYFRYGYIPSPHAIFRNVYKVEPGEVVEFQLESRTITKRRYWDVLNAYDRGAEEMSEAEALDAIEEVLASAFRYRLVSDVPVGVFLSGGYDSSAVAALLQKDRTEKIRTFTIGFEHADFDEAPVARRIAEHLGTDHHELYCSADAAKDLLGEIPEIWDEPFGDSSAIPTTLVARLARKHVTVALSADGGDELFAGYDKYPEALAVARSFACRHPQLSSPLTAIGAAGARALGRVVPDALDTAGKMEKLHRIVTEGVASTYLATKPQAFPPALLAKLLRHNQLDGNGETAFDRVAKPIAANRDTLTALLATDYATYMVDDILTKVDRATMSVGLEGRDPFLDQRIVELLGRVPSSLKMKDGVQKHLLKSIVHRHIPQEMLTQKKHGFSVPVSHWFSDKYTNYLHDYLDPARARREGILDPNLVNQTKNNYLAGRAQDRKSTRLNSSHYS